jgi:orotate phosphoribosyltransferase
LFSQFHPAKQIIMATRPPLANERSKRDRAFDLIKQRSYREGEFVLASGKKSNFYLDMKPTMFHPEGANLLAELVLEKLADLNIDYVGGMAVGAIPLVTAVTVLSARTARPLPGFFVRKEAKDHGTKRRVDAVADLNGKNVAILEDVTTTGDSSMQAVEAATGAGAKVALVLSLVDRGEGALEFYKTKGIPFAWLFHLSEFQSSGRPRTTERD